MLFHVLNYYELAYTERRREIGEQDRKNTDGEVSGVMSHGMEVYIYQCHLQRESDKDIISLPAVNVNATRIAFRQHTSA